MGAGGFNPTVQVRDSKPLNQESTMDGSLRSRVRVDNILLSTRDAESGLSQTTGWYKKTTNENATEYAKRLKFNQGHKAKSRRQHSKTVRYQPFQLEGRNEDLHASLKVGQIVGSQRFQLPLESNPYQTVDQVSAQLKQSLGKPHRRSRLRSAVTMNNDKPKEAVQFKFAN